LVERFFNKIKQCRRVATRYDKLAANYLAFIQLAAKSIRRFCAQVKARFAECTDPVATRDFIKSHIKQIVFNNGKLSVIGSIPNGERGAAPLAFRIDGEIDATRSMVASRLRKQRTEVKG
jgi:hypothetical protein